MSSLMIPFGPNSAIRAVPSESQVSGWRAIDLLHFPPETLAVMTPFRRQVITYIYRTALDLAHGSLESAEISASEMPDEEYGMALDVILTVNGDWQVVEELRSAILAKVAEWSTEEWSTEQQSDYGKWIFVCVEPKRS